MMPQEGLLPPPRFLFLEFNSRCNLKCRHCMFWMNSDDDRDAWMDRARRTELLEELADMSPSATVVSCGGEPMLDAEDWFHVGRECGRLGLSFFSVVNGTGVVDDAVADRIMAEGPTEITVSVDGHTAEIHDAARRVPGSFDAAMGALRRLVAARNRAGSTKRIYAMTIVCERNYRHLDAFYDLILNDVGADKLKLNILQPTFGLADNDACYEKNLVRDPRALVALIRACDEKYELGINPVWLRQVEMYHRSMHAGGKLKRGWQLDGTSEHICNTYERNVMVDRYGFARLCFAPSFRGAQLADRGDLARFWASADDIRARMRTCNRPCGISHSVRRESATLQREAVSSWQAP